MTLLLPGWPLEDANAQAKFDTIGLAWPNRNVGVFSAYRSTVVAAVSGVALTVVFDVEDFDRSSWYDSATGRYTPTVAGYYRLNANVGIATTVAAGTRLVTILAKNGAEHRYLSSITVGANDDNSVGGSCLVAANGTTDYFTVQFLQNSGANKNVAGTAQQTYFQGELLAP